MARNTAQTTDTAHKITAQTKMRVTMLLAWGRELKRIAEVLAITVPELKRLYRDELTYSGDDRTWVARDRVNVMLAEKFLQLLMDDDDMRAGLELRAMMQVSDETDVPEPQTRFGKKELAKLEARKPDSSTPLGELVARRDNVGFELHRLGKPDSKRPVAHSRSTTQ
jgi:hypothetical protein